MSATEDGGPGDSTRAPHFWEMWLRGYVLTSKCIHLSENFVDEVE